MDIEITISEHFFLKWTVWNVWMYYVESQLIYMTAVKAIIRASAGWTVRIYLKQRFICKFYFEK